MGTPACVWIWAHRRGRCWSAKIDGISLWPAGLGGRVQKNIFLTRCNCPTSPLLHRQHCGLVCLSLYISSMGPACVWWDDISVWAAFKLLVHTRGRISSVYRVKKRIANPKTWKRGLWPQKRVEGYTKKLGGGGGGGGDGSLVPY